MDNFNIHRDIQARIGGEIYISAAGPVRTGKSIFIKQFMELLVLLTTKDDNLRNLSRDELPQSAVGKTIIATEPKLIPKKVAKTSLAGGIEAKVRLIDYVGFMVEGAADHVENGEKRLVKMPWFNYDIPFTQAAELGTRKVINDHSTIGVVVTTDGSISETKRPGYMVAEKQTIDELKKLGKPSVVLLNFMKPYPDETTKLVREMSEGCGVSVLPVNCEQLKKGDVFHILEKVLKEFSVTEMDFHISKWLEILSATRWLGAQVIQAAKGVTRKVSHMKDVAGELAEQRTDTIRSMNIKNMQMADGHVAAQADMDDSYYYRVPSDYAGLPIEDEYQLTQTLSSLANIQKEYEEVQNALTQVRLKGYGAVTPECLEIVLDEPQAIKHDNKHGVKMKAEASSISPIKTHIEMEIVPVVGSEQQVQDLITYIKENARESDDGIWNINIFGKSIEQIMEDGIQAKVSQMTEDCQLKLQDTLQKITNDNNGGIICITI